MSYSLNSLKGYYIGGNIGTTIGFIEGDTRSLGYSSYRLGMTVALIWHLCGSMLVWGRISPNLVIT